MATILTTLSNNKLSQIGTWPLVPAGGGHLTQWGAGGEGTLQLLKSFRWDTVEVG